MTIKEIIDMLKDLKSHAEYRSRRIIEDGNVIPEEWKARDDGVASGYGFCILLLEKFLEKN